MFKIKVKTDEELKKDYITAKVFFLLYSILATIFLLIFLSPEMFMGEITRIQSGILSVILFILCFPMDNYADRIVLQLEMRRLAKDE